jgi:ElaB/YqjD/DUF883 family membrane-anchored ribosome-binding protein
MNTERGSNPGPSDRSWTQATPSPRPAEDPSSTGDPSSIGHAGTVGQAIETEVERAGSFVKDAVGKARERVAEYREGGMEKVTQEVTDYTRSQPVAALLIAAGVGMVLGMLLGLSRR